MIHSFLLIGQSNMAGRGDITEAPAGINSKIKVLRNGRWQNCYRPINCDRRFSGYCLAESFAEEYLKEHNGVEVGLIPCADGGTSLNQWRCGGLLFDNAVYQAKLALRTSHIVGILWHQGEADCAKSLYPLYREKLEKIIDGLRTELGLADVPFISGGLGEYLDDFNDAPELKNYWHINQTLESLAKDKPFFGYASSEGLTHKGDILHFNTASLIEFGKRYYDSFKLLEDKNKVYAEKFDEDEAYRTEMEKL